MDYFLLILPIIGFIIGLLVTTLGGGGGSMYVPILTLLGVNPQVAVASSLATVLPTTSVGAYSHYKQNHVYLKVGLILGIAGIFGSLIGAYIGSLIPPIVLKKALGILLLIMIIPMIRGVLKEYKKEYKDDKKFDKTQEHDNNSQDKNNLKHENKNKNKNNLSYEEKITSTYQKIILLPFGIISGILAGVFGLSGGGPISSALYGLGVPTKVVVGTTVFVLIFNSIAGTGGYLLLGHFDLNLTLLLVSGTVIGGFFGPKLLDRINKVIIERVIPPILILISLSFGLGLLL